MVASLRISPGCLLLPPTSILMSGAALATRRAGTQGKAMVCSMGSRACHVECEGPEVGPWVMECNCLKAITWYHNLDAILEIVDLEPMALKCPCTYMIVSVDIEDAFLKN